MKRSRAFTLSLGTGILSSALELIRRTLEPRSSTLPHVTVRYTKLGLTDEAERKYLSTRISDLVLAEPMTFDTAGSTSKELRTLVFRCESLTLEALVYKPDFFETVSHCTVYDGPPSKLAYQAYERLSNFEWDLHFPRDLRIEAYPGRPKERRLSPQASLLISQVMGKKSFSLAVLDSMSDLERLDLLDELSQVMQRETSPPTPTVRKRTLHVSAGGPPLKTDTKSVFQPALFTFGQTAGLLASIGPDMRRSKKRAGDVPTPPEVASQLVHHLNSMRGTLRPPIRFGDPALGAGVFFAQTALLHGESVESATGVEINPVRADRTAYFYRNSGLRVITGDFLALPPEVHSWNFVAANPPYLKSRDVPDAALRLAPSLFKELSVRLDGRADYYMYFLLATHLWLAPGAVSVWLIPSEFTTTQSGEALRKYLSTRVRCRQIHFFDASSGSLFQDVMVTSCAVFFENVPPKEDDFVRVTTGGQVNRPETSEFHSIGTLRRSPRWSVESLRHQSEASPFNDQVPLGSLVSVKRGIATGANKLFVLKHADANSLDPTQTHTRMVLPRAHLLPVDGVVRSDLLEAQESLVNIRWLIDTDESLQSLMESAPALASYLQGIESSAMSSALVKRRSPFYRQDRQRSCRFFFSYMSKQKNLVGNRRFFLNQSDAVALNNYLVLEPLPMVEAWLAEDAENEVRFLDALRAVPEGELARRGTRYATGLLKLEPRDVREILVRVPRGLGG